jgi:3-hydroxybutyryl-CoA dehydratase
MPDYVLYEDLEVGQELPPAVFRITDEVIDSYTEATGDDSPVYSREGSTEPGTRRLAPPTLAAVYVRPVLMSMPSPPGGIHAKQRYEFHRPVFSGDVLVTQARILDKYLKKARRYVVMETMTTNQDGEIVTTGRMVRIWAR